jgi:hypothetical protein
MRNATAQCDSNGTNMLAMNSGRMNVYNASMAVPYFWLHTSICFRRRVRSERLTQYRAPRCDVARETGRGQVLPFA